MSSARQRVTLSIGEVEYVDTGGNGPTIVFLHGLLMDETLWDQVLELLGPGARCVVPALPFGAHRLPVAADADLSLTGLSGLVLEFITELGLRDVTLVGNDTGGAVCQLLVAHDPSNIDRLVLVSCEAFENWPPGLTGRTVIAAGKLPRALFLLFLQQLRLKAVRRTPMAFGWLTRRGDRVVKRWLRPVLSDPRIRRDTRRLLRTIAGDGPNLVRASEALGRFDKPALVVWAARDRVMPPDHAARLVNLMPQARLLEIDDTRTLIPLDQPAALATSLATFVELPAGARPHG